MVSRYIERRRVVSLRSRSQTAWEAGFPSPLSEQPATGDEVCRCGVRITRGAPCFEFTEVPETLGDLLAGRTFCGLACVRAFLLEALGLNEASASPSFIRDLREAYSALRVVFAFEDAQRLAGALLPFSGRA